MRWPERGSQPRLPFSQGGDSAGVVRGGTLDRTDVVQRASDGGVVVAKLFPAHRQDLIQQSERFIISLGAEVHAAQVFQRRGNFEMFLPEKTALSGERFEVEGFGPRVVRATERVDGGVIESDRGIHVVTTANRPADLKCLSQELPDPRKIA